MLSGFVQLSLSHNPSSLCSRLNTFGLPLESVLCDTPSISLSFDTLRAVFYLGYKILKRAAPSLFLFLTNIQILRKKPLGPNKPKASRLRSQFVYAGKVLKSRSRSIEPIYQKVYKRACLLTSSKIKNFCGGKESKYQRDKIQKIKIFKAF